MGIFVADRVPDGVGFDIERGSLENILGVLASSMPAVSVFSPSTMVSAYASASATVTPRAARLPMEDNTSQNVLGTFIRSFLHAPVGVVALGTGLYGDKGRLILPAITAVLLVFIVATLLRWIDDLARFGRVSEVAERVEDATWRASSARLEDPLLGGREASGAGATPTPRSRTTLTASGLNSPLKRLRTIPCLRFHHDT